MAMARDACPAGDGAELPQLIEAGTGNIHMDSPPIAHNMVRGAMREGCPVRVIGG